MEFRQGSPDSVEKSTESGTLSSLEIGKLLEKIRAGLTGKNGRKIGEEIEAILRKSE